MKFIFKSWVATITSVMVWSTAIASPIDNSRYALVCERLAATVLHVSVPNQCHYSPQKTAAYLNLAAAKFSQNKNKKALINLKKSETELRQFSSEGECRQFLPRILDLTMAVIQLEQNIH